METTRHQKMSLSENTRNEVPGDIEMDDAQKVLEPFNTVSPRPPIGTNKENTVYPDLTKEKQAEAHPKSDESKDTTPVNPQQTNVETPVSEEGKTSLCSKWQMWFLVLLLLCIAAFHYSGYFSQYIHFLIPLPSNVLPVTPHKISKWEIFQQQLDVVKNSHPKQHLLVWAITEAQIKALLENRYPEKPAVVLFIAENTNSSNNAVSGIAKSVALCACNAYGDANYSHIDGRDLAKHGAVAAMHKLDDEFRNNFENKSQHVILVESIDAIPAPSQTIFIGLMDHENSKYKDAVMLLTAVSDERAPDIKDKTFLGQVEEFTRDHFMNIWNDHVPEDTRNAILSRIAVSPVLIQ